MSAAAPSPPASRASATRDIDDRPSRDVGFALQRLARDFGVRTGLDCGVHLGDEPLRLATAHADALVSIVEAALDNVARHAEASRADVLLRRTHERYQLRIRDNGRGFDPSTVPQGSSGLLGIWLRAVMLGGQFGLSSSRGRGTVVNVAFPPA